jgi:hypothetical protein
LESQLILENADPTRDLDNQREQLQNQLKAIRRDISKANAAANRIKSTWSRIKKKHEDCYNRPLIGKDVTIAQLRSRDNAAWMAKNGVALNQQLDANRAKYKGKEIPNTDLVNFFPDLDKHPGGWYLTYDPSGHCWRCSMTTPPSPKTVPQFPLCP